MTRSTVPICFEFIIYFGELVISMPISRWGGMGVSLRPFIQRLDEILKRLASIKCNRKSLPNGLLATPQNVVILHMRNLLIRYKLWRWKNWYFLAFHKVTNLDHFATLVDFNDGDIFRLKTCWLLLLAPSTRCSSEDISQPLPRIVKFWEARIGVFPVEVFRKSTRVSELFDNIHRC
jgi:hypothetical protein